MATTNGFRVLAVRKKPIYLLSNTTTKRTIKYILSKKKKQRPKKSHEEVTQIFFLNYRFQKYTIH